MWPAQVEDVAAVFRAAGIDARLEELAAGETAFPGPAARVHAFDCDGRLVIAFVAGEDAADPQRLGCRFARRVVPPQFPYAGATVYLDRALLAHRTIWIEAGAPRYAVALPPIHLARLLRAQIADLVGEGRANEAPR